MSKNEGKIEYVWLRDRAGILWLYDGDPREMGRKVVSAELGFGGKDGYTLCFFKKQQKQWPQQDFDDEKEVKDFLKGVFGLTGNERTVQP